MLLHSYPIFLDASFGSIKIQLPSSEFNTHFSMYSGEEPPAFSPAPINTTAQEALGTSIHNPVAGQGSWNSLIQFPTDQPPSVGSMRPIVVSQPSGSDQIYTLGQQPPSLNDVGRRGGSQTGVLPAGAPIPDPEELRGMSMTSATFRRFHPDAFHK